MIYWDYSIYNILGLLGIIRWETPCSGIGWNDFWRFSLGVKNKIETARGGKNDGENEEDKEDM